MHELSLCEAIVDRLRDEAQKQGFSRVLAVELDIGRWRAVEPSALELAFGVVTRGTLAEGARLGYRMVDVEAWCFECAARVTLSGDAQKCPRCNGIELQLAQGDELRVREIEVE